MFCQYPGQETIFQVKGPITALNRICLQQSSMHVTLFDKWNGSKFFRSARRSPMGMKDQNVELCYDGAVHHRYFFFMWACIFGSVIWWGIELWFWTVSILSTAYLRAVPPFLPITAALHFFPCFFRSPSATSPLPEALHFRPYVFSSRWLTFLQFVLSVHSEEQIDVPKGAPALMRKEASNVLKIRGMQDGKGDRFNKSL